MQVRKYLEDIRKAPFDEVKFKNSTKLEKQAFTAVGAGIETKAIAEKVEMNITIWWMVERPYKRPIKIEINLVNS